MRRSILAAGGAALVLASGIGLGGSASGHVKTSAGNWLFTASTYSSDNDGGSPQFDDRSDPVSVIWRGPSTAAITIGAVEAHTDQHWRDRRIPDKYPNGAFMRVRETNPLCRDAQFIFYRDGDDANHGQWSSSTAYMTTNGACGSQYHIRLWSSAVHSQMFSGAEHISEWVLAPIHHEHPAPRVPSIDKPIPSKHVIDLPWDQARSVYMHTMGEVHCIEREWTVRDENPGGSAGHAYGDIKQPYSGIISRVSLRHESDGGCSGA